MWHKILCDFKIKANHLVPDQKAVSDEINRKKYVSAGGLFKIRESKKLVKYLDLDSVLKVLWNIKVTVIPIIIRALIIIPQNIEKTLRELEIQVWIETVQTTAVLKLTTILRKVLKNLGDLLPLGIQWTPPTTKGKKKSYLSEKIYKE